MFQSILDLKKCKIHEFILGKIVRDQLVVSVVILGTDKSNEFLLQATIFLDLNMKLKKKRKI